MNERHSEIYGLIFACLSGEASESQHEELSAAIETDTDTKELFVDFAIMYSHLHRSTSDCFIFEDHKTDMAIQVENV